MKNEKIENADELETEYLTPDPLAPKRNGKIARLPRDIREALNRQLKENFNADDILEWLNDLPAVKTVLDKEFEGQPISRQNLAHWRTGGYREWANQRCAYAQLQARQKEITEKGGNPYQLGYEMAQIHAAEYLATLADLVATAPNAEARMKGLSKAMAEFRGWRRADYQAQQITLQTQRVALDTENSQWRRERETQELALKKQKVELEREKFERTHIETIVRICKNKTVREIAQDEEKDYTEIIKQIRVIMFGDEDETEESPESDVQNHSNAEGGLQNEEFDIQHPVEGSPDSEVQSSKSPPHPNSLPQGVEGKASSIVYGADAQAATKMPPPATAELAETEKADVANQQLASSEAVKVSLKDEPVGDESIKSENENGETLNSKHQTPGNYQHSTNDHQLAGGTPALPGSENPQPSTKDTQPVADGPMTLEQANKVVDEWYQKARRLGGIVVNSWDVADLRAYLSQQPAPYYSLKTYKEEFREPPARDPRYDPNSPWCKAWPYLEAEMRANAKN